MATACYTLDVYKVGQFATTFLAGYGKSSHFNPFVYLSFSRQLRLSMIMWTRQRAQNPIITTNNTSCLTRRLGRQTMNNRLDQMYHKYQQKHPTPPSGVYNYKATSCPVGWSQQVVSEQQQGDKYSLGVNKNNYQFRSGSKRAGSGSKIF